jgi:preprotein translocase subunit YajC
MIKTIIFVIVIAVISIFLYTKLSHKNQNKIEKSIDSVAKELNKLD